mmetsp:Transcript_6774/g.16875  ORF Transcript_6774/g.16875 Transcript_6774/m.16875 type:complete len:374 (-) Transcript_6774:616-1737(-)
MCVTHRAAIISFAKSPGTTQAELQLVGLLASLVVVRQIHNGLGLCCLLHKPLAVLRCKEAGLQEHALRVGAPPLVAQVHALGQVAAEVLGEARDERVVGGERVHVVAAPPAVRLGQQQLNGHGVQRPDGRARRALPGLLRIAARPAGRRCLAAAAAARTPRLAAARLQLGRCQHLGCRGGAGGRGGVHRCDAQRRHAGRLGPELLQVLHSLGLLRVGDVRVHQPCRNLQVVAAQRHRLLVCLDRALRLLRQQRCLAKQPPCVCVLGVPLCELLHDGGCLVVLEQLSIGQRQCLRGLGVPWRGLQLLLQLGDPALDDALLHCIWCLIGSPHSLEAVVGRKVPSCHEHKDEAKDDGACCHAHLVGPKLRSLHLWI